MIGPLDDLLLAALALRYAARQVPAKFSPPGQANLDCWSACSAA